MAVNSEDPVESICHCFCHKSESKPTDLCLKHSSDPLPQIKGAGTGPSIQWRAIIVDTWWKREPQTAARLALEVV